MAVSGSVIILTSLSILSTDLLRSKSFLEMNQYIFYGAVCIIHGAHCLVVYGSLFKGPTSKYGKTYQPYLPLIE